MDFSAGACKTAAKRLNDLYDAGWIEASKGHSLSATTITPRNIRSKRAMSSVCSTKILLRMEEISGWYAQDIDSFDGGSASSGLTADLLQKRQNSGSMMTPDEINAMVAGRVKQIFTVSKVFC